MWAVIKFDKNNLEYFKKTLKKNLEKMLNLLSNIEHRKIQTK